MKKSLLLQEFKAACKNKKLLVPIIAVIMIPILYAGMFLYAFWDPYDHMEDIPVAIVNADGGAIYEDKDLDLGDELVTKLKEDPDFDYHFVDEEEAFQDLQDQKYYMLIKIPENFSQNATTLLDDSPQKLEMIYVPNESYNFLSAQIGETAMLQIEATLEEKITETYAETIFDKVNEMSNGFADAHEGASKINEGSSELNDGANELDTGALALQEGSLKLNENLHLLAEKSIELKDGTSKLNSGSIELADGTTVLSDGISQLETGQKSLLSGAKEAQTGTEKVAAGITQTKEGLGQADATMEQIIQGSDQISTGADQLADSLTEWKDGADQTAAGANEVSQGIELLEQQVGQILAASPQLPGETKEQLQSVLEKLAAGSKQVAIGTETLSSSASELKNGANTLADSVNELSGGQRALKTGIHQLYNGSIELETGTADLTAGQKQLIDGISLFGEKLTDASKGATQLAKGASDLAGGTKELVDGSDAFVEGTGQLAEGSNQLEDGTTELVKGTVALTDGTIKLVDGSDELAINLEDAADKSNIKTDEDTYNMMANPVEVENQKMNEVPNYGTGFAPYFLSLGLFVGALLLSIVYPLRDPASTPRSATNWFMSKFIVLISIGVIQALIASGILLIGLGLEVQSVPLFILYAVITSLTFITLIQFLVTCFGDPGRFIAIIVLILQLTTSAGTFPLELIPKALQFFNLLLPMTYTVSGFKAVISSGNFAVMWQNAGVLLGFTSVFMIGAFSYFLLMFKRKYGSFPEDEAAATAE